MHLPRSIPCRLMDCILRKITRNNISLGNNRLGTVLSFPPHPARILKECSLRYYRESCNTIMVFARRLSKDLLLVNHFSCRWCINVGKRITTCYMGHHQSSCRERAAVVIQVIDIYLFYLIFSVILVSSKLSCLLFAFDCLRFQRISLSQQSSATDTVIDEFVIRFGMCWQGEKNNSLKEISLNSI